MSIVSNINTHSNITITDSAFTNNIVDNYGLFIGTGNGYITITNSTFTNNIVDNYGGGLLITTNTGTHNNITITNSAFTSNKIRGDGGGLLIYIMDSDTGIQIITITNSAFTNNTIDGYGGGLFIQAMGPSNISITYSAFTNNAIGGDGGGLLCNTIGHSNISITNSAFTSNTIGGDGGGLFIYSNTGTHNIAIINSAFLTNNIIGGNGSGLHIYSATGTHAITITNSAFLTNNIGSNGGGMYIYIVSGIHNNITITNSVFTNNTAHGFGGGLWIHVQTSDTITITCTNSSFINNIIIGDGGGLVINTNNGTHNNITITNSAFTNNRVYGYGGGLYINIQTAETATYITCSTFSNNTIGGRGGGLFVYFDSSTGTLNDITIKNNDFTNNTIGGGGGGGVFYFATGTHNITITNSAFTNNRVDHNVACGLHIYTDTSTKRNININTNTNPNNGGGLLIDTSTDSTGAYTNIIITNSDFSNNTISCSIGGGLSIIAYAGTHNVSITNSAFSNNNIISGFGGGLFISVTHNNNITTCITNSAFTSNTAGYGGGLCIDTETRINNNVIIIKSIFANNKGSGILVLTYVTLIFTEGHSIVANNSSPTDGGGISLADNSYLTTSNGGRISFINNTANRYGGAIYSTDNDNALLRYKVIYHNQLYDRCTVYNLSATFINNSAARAGDNLYGGVLTICNISTSSNDYEYLHYLLQCINVPDKIKHAPSVHPLSPVSSDPIVVCPCVDGFVKCNIASLHREVYPGQIFNVSLVTVGLCGGVSPGTVVVEHDNQIKLISGTTTDYTSTSCTTLNYTVKLTTNIISKLYTTITLNIADADIIIKIGSRPINLTLAMLPCPLGLVVDFTSGDCVCNNNIIHVSGVICNTSWMPRPIQRSGNNWIYHRFDYYNCTIAHIGCPFDYCQESHIKFSLNESDLQCNYNRSGILCG